MKTECAVCSTMLEDLEGTSCPRCGAVLCSSCFLATNPCPNCGLEGEI